MNLIQFLKEVDAVAAEMSVDDMRGFIHEAARILNEKDRSSFLKLLRSGKSGKLTKNRKDLHKSMTQECENILKKLEKISKGELYLTGFMDYESEDYDFKDYWDYDEDEYIYQDPYGVASILDNAIEFVHKCLDCEIYDLGDKVVRALIDLTVCVDDNEYDIDELTLEDMSDEDLIHSDYNDFVCDAIYVEYNSVELADRPKAVYDTMINLAGDCFYLTYVLQGAPEIKDIKDFLPIWIDYLGEQREDIAWELIQEALELADDAKLFLNTARKYYENYPLLYKKYLDKNPGKDSIKTLYQIGREAIDKLDISCMVRSQIALDTAARALKLGNTLDAEDCWLEAFRSDTSVLNYLRLRMEHHNYEEVREEVKRIYQGHKSDKKPYTDYFGNLKNIVDERTYFMLCFLEGDVDYAIEYGMNYKGSLGWSRTFMKAGLSTLLFLLTKEEYCGSGCVFMLDMIISIFDLSIRRYEQGILLDISDTNNEFFRVIFNKWKKSITLSEKDKQKYLKRAEELVDRRVDGILAAKRRNYYNECAAYVAALGEAKESNGVSDGRQLELQEYRNKYSHYNKFITELRSFGMTDQKKKKKT